MIELPLYFAIALIVRTNPLLVELKALDDKVIAIRPRLLLVDRSWNWRGLVRWADGPRRRE